MLKQKIILSLCSVVISLSACEVFFQFYCFSDSFNFTLASQQWFKKYWQPLNSLGYRDIDYSQENLNNKNLIIILGDSIVAGHGIEDARDRFSNLLENKLGPKWKVLSVAKCGWDTRNQLMAIRNLNITPKFLVLSYFINDIEGIAYEHGLIQPDLVTQNLMPRNPLIQNSYFVNFLYWRLLKYYYSRAFIEYFANLEKAYLIPEIWRSHSANLLSIRDYAKDRQVPFLVLGFPLFGYGGNEKIFDKLNQFFDLENIDFLDLSDKFEHRPISDLIVGKDDFHPSKIANKVTSESLFKVICDRISCV